MNEPKSSYDYEDLLACEPPADEEAWAVYQLGNCHLLEGELGKAAHG